MPSPLLVFDLDGTLVDTAPDLISTLNAVMAIEGVPPTALAEARHIVGGGARVMIERAFAGKSVKADQPTMDRLFKAFIEHYSAHIADTSRPFPGLIDALDHLERDGFRFAVCTNKLEGLARLLLDKLDLTRRFVFICGQDTFGAMKPDPLPLLKTIEAAGGDPVRAIMIGDSATDVRTARAAKVPVVVVEFGYSDIPAEALGGDVLIRQFAELTGAVHSLLR
jgi:phosphoglycolate phosphatase